MSGNEKSGAAKVSRSESPESQSTNMDVKTADMMTVDMKTVDMKTVDMKTVDKGVPVEVAEEAREAARSTDGARRNRVSLAPESRPQDSQTQDLLVRDSQTRTEPVSRRGLLIAGASGMAALAGGSLAAQASRAGSAAASRLATGGALNQLALQTAAGPVNWAPKFLTVQQSQLLAHLCDTLLPRTGTPGATDAGVPQWIDLSISVAEPDEQLAFLGGLGWLDQRAQSLHGRPYLDLTPDQQTALLEEISDKNPTRPENLEPGAAFFADLKSRALFAYFTSEKGRTEYLGLPAKVQREQMKGCQHASH